MLIQYFHFALTGGVEMQKMFDLRMRRVFCFGQNNEMRSKYISYKSVQIIQCPGVLGPFTVA